MRARERLRRLDDNAFTDSVRVQYTVIYPPFGLLLGLIAVVAGIVLAARRLELLLVSAVGLGWLILALVFAPEGTTRRIVRHPITEWLVLVRRLRTEGRVNR